MYSLSALYTLQYVPIVTYSCKLLYSKKKQNKQKKEKDPHFGMGKNTKVMPQKPRYLSLLLGKGGNPYVSKTLHKKLSKSALSALPPACKNILIQTLCGRCTPKLTKIDQIQFTLPQLSHLSSNRRVRNLPLYFKFTTLARELTHRTKFIQPRKTRISEMPCFFAT